MLLDGPITPMLCTPGRALPEGEGWVLEPKWDGIRAVAHVTEDGPRLFTRHGRPHHDRFPRLNAALAELPVGTVLDGELACLQPLAGGRVRCRFDRVSAFMVSRTPHRPDADGLTATLVAFDVLAVAGADLRAAPWHERRAQLEALLDGVSGALRLTPGARRERGAARRPDRRRLGGHRGQAHRWALPLRAPQPVVGEAQVPGGARPRPPACPASLRPSRSSRIGGGGSFFTTKPRAVSVISPASPFAGLVHPRRRVPVALSAGSTGRARGAPGDRSRDLAAVAL